MRYSHASVIALLAAPLCGQGSAVVPASASTVDGQSCAIAPGATHAMRHMVLVDMPPALHNKALTSVAFRRDVDSKDFGSGSVDATVTLSYAPHSAVAVQPSFGANHGAGAATVFQGVLTIPASASSDGRAVDWSNAFDIIEIPFAQPFAFTVGTLAIQIDAQPAPSDAAGFWAIDAECAATSGTVIRLGTSCSPSRVDLDPPGTPASIFLNQADLTPGSTPRVVGHGSVGASSFLMIGFLPLDLDLGALGVGGLGCKLGLVSEATVAGVFEDRSFPWGETDISLQIPIDPGMLSATFYLQYAEFGLPIYTSETLECHIGNATPTLGSSYVFSDFNGPTAPTAGKVRTWMAPVVRFTHQ